MSCTHPNIQYAQEFKHEQDLAVVTKYKQELGQLPDLSARIFKGAPYRVPGVFLVLRVYCPDCKLQPSKDQCFSTAQPFENIPWRDDVKWPKEDEK